MQRRPAAGRVITEASRRWAEDAGRVLAEWHTPLELRAPGIRANAYQRLSIAASVYLDGTGQEWTRGISYFDTIYLLADIALEAFSARAEARLADGYAGRRPLGDSRRPGGPDLYPHNQAQARMEQLAIAYLDIVGEHDDEEPSPEEDEYYVVEQVPRELMTAAWRIVAPEWPYMHAPRRPEPLIRAASSEDRFFETYGAEATALADYGISLLQRVAASRGIGRSSGLVGDPPPAQPFGVSPQGAERLAAAWMEHLGASGVMVTRTTKDGGLDVEADQHVAQVKAWAGPVGVVEVRALAGVAAHDKQGRTPLFFATTGYTAEALAFAEHTADMALFIMDAEHGHLIAVTPKGARLRDEGLWDVAGAG